MADAREQWRDEFTAALWAQLGSTANVVFTSVGLTFRGYHVDFIMSGDDPAGIDIHVGDAASGAIDAELFDVNVNDDAHTVATDVANWLRERT
jgi:uncharacterized membrane protein